MIGAQKYLNVECVGPAPALMRGLRRKEAQIQALMERAEPKNAGPAFLGLTRRDDLGPVRDFFGTVRDFTNLREQLV